MITYEQAKKLALKENPKYNQVFDYGDAWAFSIKNDQSDNNRLTVVTKKGEIMMFTEYILMRNTNASPKNIPF